MKKKLAIIGASYLQMPLVQRANELGIETICFAWEDGAVCRDICKKYYPISIVNKEEIFQVCCQENIDGITSIASDIAVPTVAYIANKLELTGNSVESASYSTNKCLMRKALSQGGVNCPIFWPLSQKERVEDIVVTENYPLIVKPADRSGSQGVCKVNNSEELDNAVNIAFKESFAKQVVVEEFVEGVEVSVEYISWQGKHYFLSITDKTTSGPPHYVELAHHQPSMLSSASCDEIRNQTELGLSELNIENGASHSEFIITPEGKVFVVEIGARMGGDFIGAELVQLSTGYDFLEGVIGIALGEFHPPVFTKQQCAGIWFYSEKTQSAYEYIINNNHYKKIIKAELFEETLRILRKSADRSGYFIYVAQERFLLP